MQKMYQKKIDEIDEKWQASKAGTLNSHISDLNQQVKNEALRIDYENQVKNDYDKIKLLEKKSTDLMDKSKVIQTLIKYKQDELVNN